MAVGVAAFFVGEAEKRLRCGEVPVQLARIGFLGGGVEQVVGRLAHQHGAGDLPGTPVREAVAGVLGQELPVVRGPRDVAAVVEGPAQDRAPRPGVGDQAVHFLVVLGCRAPDGFLVRQRKVRGQGGDGVEDTVEGDDGCQARLVGGRAGREVTAETDAEQRGAGRIDTGVPGEEVQDGTDHMLPVRPEGRPAPVDGRGLPWAVERQDVVAAFLPAECAGEVQFLGGAVESVVHHHRRPRALACRPVEVAVQHGVLVGDLHGRDAGEVGDGVAEAGDAALVGVVDARVLGVAVEEELGRPVVTGGAQQSVACADGVASACLGLQAFGGGEPGVVPAVVVAGSDAGGGGDDFADVRAAVGGETQVAQGLEPEGWIVVEHQLFHDNSRSAKARNVPGGRPVRRWTVSEVRSSAPSAMARSMPASIVANSSGISAAQRSRSWSNVRCRCTTGRPPTSVMIAATSS